MTPITLEQAQTIIAGALAKGAVEDMNGLCVVVLDAGGRIIASVRQDGVSFGRIDVAHAKAFGAISIGLNSRAIEQMAIDRPHFIGGVSGAIGGALVPVAGGVIVLDGEAIRVGAVGISGDTSDNDELAAVAGIESAGLRPLDS